MPIGLSPPRAPPVPVPARPDSLPPNPPLLSLGGCLAIDQRWSSPSSVQRGIQTVLQVSRGGAATHIVRIVQQRAVTRCQCVPEGGALGRGRGGVWHKASVSDCLPLAAPIGLSPLLILTLCGPERVLVVSTEPPDDLSCLTTPGVGCPGDGAVARAVDQVHPDAHSESMRGFADPSTDLGGGGGSDMPFPSAVPGHTCAAVPRIEVRVLSEVRRHRRAQTAMAVADAAGPGLAPRKVVAEGLAVVVAEDLRALLQRRPGRDRVLPLQDVAALCTRGAGAGGAVPRDTDNSDCGRSAPPKPIPHTQMASAPLGGGGGCGGCGGTPPSGLLDGGHQPSGGHGHGTHPPPHIPLSETPSHRQNTPPPLNRKRCKKNMFFDAVYVLRQKKTSAFPCNAQQTEHSSSLLTIGKQLDRCVASRIE